MDRSELTFNLCPDVTFMVKNQLSIYIQLLTNAGYHKSADSDTNLSVAAIWSIT